MVLRATWLFFGRHYLNFGQHDSGFRRHDFGRDDSRATWSISFRAFHLTFPVDEVIWYLKVTLNSHSKGHLSLLLVTWSRRCMSWVWHATCTWSANSFKKKACGVDEWVNACCDILLRRERSRDNFLVDRLSGLPRITEYLLSMLYIPWYEIDLMLRLTWT